ncbi:DUF3426 domain-containing protein [Microbulbifer yueqingensis]|uniref:MJ0042 family finger-like domain-containing protein n=1 Tax=Microbulbifer yueqingensis TaxID=658219 RepID=A0A1G9CF05_9GAMM|nr:DUF3426 domain-containing protein [Microbulbifer yueqingensis]SDK50015.1 MJ0042 family finger-like domain-containing protein [Microbulbifer yueqingensis]
MSQLVTRCPHCSTSFHVSEQQLRAARGAVRCGSCLQVFRADENIVFAESEVDSDKDLEALLEDDDFLIHDDILLDEDEQPTPPTVATPGPEAGTYRDDEEQPLIGDAFGETQWEELDGTPDAAAAGIQPEDEDTSAFPDRPDQEEESSGPDSDFPGHGHETPPRGVPAAGTAAHHEDVAASGPGRITPDHIPERERLISAIEPAPLEVGWPPNGRRRVPGWLWGLLALVLALALVVQLGYYRFDTFARQQPWRSLYAQLCPLLDCELPQLEDLRAIRTSNLVVRSHPDIEGALVVDAVLLNTADFPQPFPDLLLRFSDLKNQPVASRKFEPREYLQGELAGRSQMPPGSPVHIAIEIVDPGREAINYELLTTR